MKKILILALVACTTTISLAQIPRTITIPPNAQWHIQPQADEPCNNVAGTFTLGATGSIDQSNDTDLPLIFLCYGDSIFIDHNQGSADLSSDPDPATPAGITWAFYECPPTITGPTLQDIQGGAGGTFDPCFIAGASGDLVVASGGAINGDIWMFNDSTIQMSLFGGAADTVFFAPITIDNFSNLSYEVMMQGSAPGPCVNVNTAAAFGIVYLNAITPQGVTTSFNGNSCTGRFRITGGYPEVDDDALFTITVVNKFDPTIEAYIYTPTNQMTNNSQIVFSVPVTGTYVVTIEDGKSCNYTFEMNMTACNPSQSVIMEMPDLAVEPGEIFCVPVTVDNMQDVLGFSISLNWDPNMFQFQGVQNPNIPGFAPAENLNQQLTAQGQLGVIYADGGAGGPLINLPDGSILLEMCFQAVGPTDSCSNMEFSNFPTAVNMENSVGQQLAIAAFPGAVCIEYDTVAVVYEIIPSCDSTNTLRLTLNGNIAPYEILWRKLPAGATNFDDNIPANIPYDIPGLTPGQWVITVTPDNGAGIGDQLIDTITLTSPLQLGASLDLTGLPSCNGLTDGSVQANVFVGTNPVTLPNTDFTFQWSPAGVPNPSGFVQTNVGPGNYAVTVTQVSTGCTALASGTLGQPASLNDGDVNITDASCTGVDDGAFDFEVVGGTAFGGGTYQFTIFYSTVSNDPNAVEIDNTLGNPYALNSAFSGFYRIDVEDANGCTFSQEIEVGAQRELTIDNPTLTQPTCNGGDDGAIMVTITESQPSGNAFFFSWVPGGTVNNTALTSTISDIPAGTYVVTAVDNDGCSVSSSIDLGEPSPVTALTSPTNPTCPNPNGGAITAQGTGGTGSFNSYTYVWAPGGEMTASITGLSEGTYTVTVTDAVGCTSTAEVSLALPLPPDILDIQITEVRCGSDGSLAAVAPTAVTFNWTSPNGSVINNPNQATISNLTGGTYVLLITDAVGCTNTDTITLDSVAPLTIIDTTLNHPTCFGFSDGSIAVGVGGGNPGYNYTWSVPNTPNSPIVISRPAGVYIVTVSDAEGCTTIGQFTLVNPPQITVNIANVNQVSCFGECDGTADIILVNPPDDYTFQWQDGSNDSLRVDLCAGTFDVTVTNQAGCTQVSEVTIATPTQVGADLTETIINPVTCFGFTDGSISVAGGGGNGGPYTYNWTNPAGQTGSTINNLPANEFPAAPYVVVITDNNGCTGTYSAVVETPDAITLARDEDLSVDITCFGDDSGTLAVEVTGGNPGNYTYVWSDGSQQIGVTPVVEMLPSGSYSVTVTDSEGCTGTTTILLNDPPAVQGTYELGDPLQCFGDVTELTIISISGGAGEPYSYSVNYGAPLPPTAQSQIGGGWTYVTYIDQFNCEFTDSIFVPEPDPIVVTFDPPMLEIQLGDSLVLTPSITGAVVEEFEWTPADFFTNADTLYPTLYTFESGTVTLTVSDANGCVGTGSMVIEVDANRNVYIPNVFIPGNTTGFNDHFIPKVGLGVEIVNYVRVYDRWGELMYSLDDYLAPSTESLTDGWDGRYKGKFVEPGVYVYAIEVKFLDNKVLLYRGDITVIR